MTPGSRVCVVAFTIASAIGCRRVEPERGAPSTSASAPIAPGSAVSAHQPGRMGVAFTADGARMIVGADVWDVAKGVRLARLPSTRRSTFSPDGSAVASLGAGEREGSRRWTLTRLGGATREVSADAVEWLDAGASLLSKAGGRLALHTATHAEPVDLGPAEDQAEWMSSPTALLVVGAKELVVRDPRTGAERARGPRTRGQLALVGDHVAACDGEELTIAPASSPAEGKRVKLDGVARACRGAGGRVFVETSTGASVVDAATATTLYAVKLSSSYAQLTPSRDGRHFFAGQRVFDVERRREGRLDGDGPAWAASGTWVAVERESSVAIADAAADSKIVAWLRGSLLPWRAGRTPWVDGTRVATVHDDVLTIWRVPEATPHARLPLRGWRPGGEVLGYGGVSVTPALATWFVTQTTDDGRETRVALARLSDLRTVWLAAPPTGDGALLVTDERGAPANVEDVLR